jgi:hypothetical protein
MGIYFVAIFSPKSPPTPISRYDAPMAERLQKIMARAGIASRRKAEELIAREGPMSVSLCNLIR